MRTWYDQKYAVMLMVDINVNGPKLYFDEVDCLMVTKPLAVASVIN